MRSSGVQVLLYKSGDVQAACKIDYARLRNTFKLLSPARYREFFQTERYEEDFPTALLICDEHHSIINTLHPEQAEANNAS